MSWLNSLIVKIKGDNSDLDSKLSGSKSKVESFIGSVQKWGRSLLAVTGAWVTLKKSLEQTESTMDLLESTTQAFKGGYAGLVNIIAQGGSNWSGLIDSITRTARAYRDLAIAQDEAQDIEASNEVKKSYLARELQAARLAYQTAEDPALKSQYLQQAIAAQKAITDINISEFRARVEAYEGSLKTMAGLDDKASENMIANFRKIAANESSFFGESGQLAMLKIEKESLAWKEMKVGLSDVEKKHYDLVRAAVANLEIYQELRDSMGPGMFLEYVKSLAGMNNAASEGDQALYRLTGQLDNVNDKLKEGSVALGGYFDPDKVSEVLNQAQKMSDGMAKIFGFSSAEQGKSQLAPGPKAPKTQEENPAEKWQQSWQEAIMMVTNFMSDEFTKVFESIGSGSFEGFGDDLLKSFGNLVSNLGKLLVAMGTTMLYAKLLAKAPTIPTAIAAIAAGAAAMAIGGLITGMASRGSESLGSGGGSGGGTSGNYGSSTQSLKIIVEGVTRGRDIYWSNRRYEEELKRNT